MTEYVLADTGPLVALLDRNDQDHHWVVNEARRLPPRMLTCEAVLSETHYLTRGLPEAKSRLAEWMAAGWLEVPFRVQEHYARVHTLMLRYQNVPMSFADACLVSMSELWPEGPVFTLDSDFRIYRRHQRQTIPLLCPPAR